MNTAGSLAGLFAVFDPPSRLSPRSTDTLCAIWQPPHRALSEKNKFIPRTAAGESAVRSFSKRYRSNGDRNDTIERKKDESAATTLGVLTGGLTPGNADAKSFL